jgi:hypothetical protein
MINELQSAIDRTHNLIREMREDGISDAAIMAAIGQAAAETAAAVSMDDKFLRGCADDIYDMMKRAEERTAR